MMTRRRTRRPLVSTHGHGLEEEARDTESVKESGHLTSLKSQIEQTNDRAHTEKK